MKNILETFKISLDALSKIGSSKRKGYGKAIWIVASITAMMLIILVYYTSVSGFLSETVTMFNNQAEPGQGVVPDYTE